MSGGLKFTMEEHGGIYGGDLNAYKVARNAPYESSPKRRGSGRYLNCDPLVIASLIKEILVKKGVDILTFAQRELYDKIGIRRMINETDTYGNPLFCGFNFGTARDWGRFGLLYLQNGKWQGKQILTEDWVKFVRTPAPAWEYPVYGGFFWLNNCGSKGISAFPMLPESTFYAQSGGGQLTIIDPDDDLVIVRLGHTGQDMKKVKVDSTSRMLEKLMEVPKSQ